MPSRSVISCLLVVSFRAVPYYDPMLSRRAYHASGTTHPFTGAHFMSYLFLTPLSYPRTGGLRVGVAFHVPHAPALRPRQGKRPRPGPCPSPCLPSFPPGQGLEVDNRIPSPAIPHTTYHIPPHLCGKVEIGGKDCTQKYSASILNVSGSP